MKKNILYYFVLIMVIPLWVIGIVERTVSITELAQIGSAVNITVNICECIAIVFGIVYLVYLFTHIKELSRKTCSKLALIIMLFVYPFFIWTLIRIALGKFFWLVPVSGIPFANLIFLWIAAFFIMAFFFCIGSVTVIVSIVKAYGEGLIPKYLKVILVIVACFIGYAFFLSIIIPIAFKRFEAEAREEAEAAS